MSIGNIPSDKAVIDFLDSIIDFKNEKSIKSYISIKNAINIFSIPFPRTTINKGAILYRGRLHESEDVFFEKITDIGPRIDFNGITDFGRANEPLQSIFYCSDKDHIAFFETSKIAREKLDIDSETMTIGVWEVVDDLNVGHIVSNRTISGLNPTMDGLQAAFEELILKFKNQGTELHLKVLDLLSNEFTHDAQNDTSNYLISCAFANYIYNTRGYDTRYKERIKLDGIAFPSVAYRKDGMNFALQYDVIDCGKVKLVSAVKKTMNRTGKKEYSDTMAIECKGVDEDKNLIIW